MISGSRVAAVCGVFAVSFVLSFVHLYAMPVHPHKPSGELLAGAQMPEGLRKIVQQKCADCHSQQTHLPLYGRFAPVSWMLERDIADARRHWDASHWNEYTVDEQIRILTDLAIRARLATMPPARYTFLHPANKLEPIESASLYTWAREERRRLRSLSSQPEKTNAKK